MEMPAFERFSFQIWYDGAEIYWVECERCSSWFHIYCVTKDEEQMKLDAYVCEICI